MGFQISGLPLQSFAGLLQMDADQLQAAGVIDLRVEDEHTWPCRVTLQDAVPGERVLLLNYRHQPAESPYAASGPIVVRREAGDTHVAVNEVPEQQRIRLLSVRAYDAKHWIIGAEVTPGTELESVIESLFADPRVAYLHLHNARYGCYSARVDRA
jgi:hypothetical protein